MLCYKIDLHTNGTRLKIGQAPGPIFVTGAVCHPILILYHQLQEIDFGIQTAKLMSGSTVEALKLIIYAYYDLQIPKK